LSEVKDGKFFVDPELQFPLITWLILLVTGQGLFVGWGFYHAILLSQQWERPDQAMAFFKTLAFTIVPIVALNFLFGSYLSHKIAAPLEKIRRAMERVSKGNLEEEIVLDQGEMLPKHAAGANSMIQRLRHILYRDYEYVQDVNKELSRLEEWFEGRNSLKPQEREEFVKLIKSAKSTISIVNTYFLRGKKEKS